MGLWDLEYSHSVKIQEKEQAESDKSIAQEKVERLKVTYQQVNDAYDRVKELQSEMKKMEDTGEEWKGSKADAYSNYISDSFNSSYTNYKNRLDEIQDSINDELTKQENKVLSLEGDILGLRQAINSLWNKIQNWVNDI